MKQVLKLFVIILFLFCSFVQGTQAKKKIPAIKNNKVFIYSPDEKSGLHIACDTTGRGFTDIGQLCSSDYAQWGQEKRMHSPFVLHTGDGKWLAVWSVNNIAPTFAAAYSDDLVNWRPQDYPHMNEHGLSTPVIEENKDNTYSVYFKSSDGVHKAIADNEFRYFNEQTGTFPISKEMLTRDTLTVDGKSYAGQLFTIPDSLRNNVISEFAARKADSEVSRETMRDDNKRFSSLTGPVKATIHVDNSNEKPISDKLIGVFFEDISHAADGGLYAELLQNGDFEYTADDHKGWTSTTAWHSSKPIRISTDNPLSKNNSHYAIIGNDSIFNEGWDGIADTGAIYNFSVYARNIAGNKSNISVAIVDKNDNILAQSTINIKGKDWKQYKTLLKTIKANGERDCRLVVVGPKKGETAIDMVSLFPAETFKGHGLRKDLAEAIAALHPRFVRFPGGCMSHGQGLDNIYHWNESVGPLKDRKPAKNIWKYHQSRGLGFYEYFQFCEDIGAEPLPVLAAGVPCQNSHANADGYGGQQGGIPMKDMPAYIDEILNMIEWANGNPATSKWAKLRADAGHPEPFNLKMIGIGNEDLISTAFRDRYLMICKAIREKYPDIQICGTVGPFHAPSSDYIEGWKIAKDNANVLDMVDEHYYESVGWFLHHQDYYDNYDRKAPKVYLGEYASRTRTMESALAEAIHLCNIERNGDVVSMTSYAPLLCNNKWPNWNPDMIYFDYKGITSLTPSYYTQKLFGNHSGDRYVKTTIDAPDSLKYRIATSVVKDSKTGKTYIKIVNALPVELDVNLEGLSIPVGTVSESFTGKPSDKSVKVSKETEKGTVVTMQPYSVKAISL